jgi:CDGSH-type Zn-finger protein
VPLQWVNDEVFCDGTHSKIGFEAVQKAVQEEEEMP